MLLPAVREGADGDGASVGVTVAGRPVDTGGNEEADIRSARRRDLLSDIRSLGLFGRAWAVGIVGFSLARALIAWPTLGRYGVSPWWFLALDIVTAPPYGIGQAVTVKILRETDRDPRDAAPWAFLVAAMFFAPYAYIFAVSGEMPLWVTAAVVAWMLLFGVVALLRMRKQVRDGAVVDRNT